VVGKGKKERKKELRKNGQNGCYKTFGLAPEKLRTTEKQRIDNFRKFNFQSPNLIQKLGFHTTKRFDVARRTGKMGPEPWGDTTLGGGGGRWIS